MKRLALWFINSLGRSILRKFRPKVVGVTGSVGKTTTKDAIYYALRGQRRVRRAAGSQNAQWGVYLALIGFEKQSGPYQRLTVPELFRAILIGLKIRLGRSFPEIVILEYGADHPGDISYLTHYFRPDVAVVTNVGPSHLVNYSSVEAIAAEKGRLVEALPGDGVAVLNHDDPRVRQMREQAPRVVFFGFEEGAQMRATEVGSSPDGVEFKLEAGEREERVGLPIRGEGGVYASLAALAVVSALGLDLGRATGSLREFEPAKGRLEVKKRAGYTVIDDSYNASPASMRSALDFLATFKGRRVAVLGEMRELGEISAQAHREVGEWAAAAADQVIVVGEGARGMLDGAKKAMFIPTVEEAKERLGEILQSGDVVLFKASRGVELERAIPEEGR